MVTRSVIRITAAEAAAAKAQSKDGYGSERTNFTNNNGISSIGQSDRLPGSDMTHSKTIEEGNTDSLNGVAAKKPDVPTEGPSTSSNKSKKRKRSNSFTIDLSDVPPQSPIPKDKRDKRTKESTSKYAGVSWNKQMNKWTACITIEGRKRHIGYYASEEGAGIDYARAVYKYKGEEALEKATKRRRSNSFTIDLSDVPPQSPFVKSKSNGRTKESTSKYIGVSWNTNRNKWVAMINLEGKSRYIGKYENEEEAGIDYARAVYKYKSKEASKKSKKYKGKDASEKSKKRQRSNSFTIDLSDVPPRSPILRNKTDGRMKDGASKYIGVSWNKQSKKWIAMIYLEGKRRFIGYYDNEDEAGIDYARAVYKYKSRKNSDETMKSSEVSGKGKKRLRSPNSFIIDLNDVPPQSPIPRDYTDGRTKNCTSKYTGVSWLKIRNKWIATIFIEGKSRHIGYYENEEDAGIDYARAVYKYKSEETLSKASGKQCKMDLSDIPSILPILKSGTPKANTSKYVGVRRYGKGKWMSQITIEKRQLHIGSYESEEKAAIDYARALLKYKGQEVLDKVRKQAAQKNFDTPKIDLSDVPLMLPILKKGTSVKGESKYVGVYRKRNTWFSKIVVEGKSLHIGKYESDEKAAVDYARAVFKYKGKGALNGSRSHAAKRTGDPAKIDLSDVPPILPILKSGINSASRYVGVGKKGKKWFYQIRMEGKQLRSGYYESEEKAAIDYARALLKYRGQEALDEVRKQAAQHKFERIDLSDVPSILPIMKSGMRATEGTSKYLGVFYNTGCKKWQSQIRVEGKVRHIGNYDSDEKAAIDYARALLKYKGQKALDRARSRSNLSVNPTVK